MPINIESVLCNFYSKLRKAPAHLATDVWVTLCYETSHLGGVMFTLWWKWRRQRQPSSQRRYVMWRYCSHLSLVNKSKMATVDFVILWITLFLRLPSCVAVSDQWIRWPRLSYDVLHQHSSNTSSIVAAEEVVEQEGETHTPSSSRCPSRQSNRSVGGDTNSEEDDEIHIPAKKSKEETP